MYSIKKKKVFRKCDIKFSSDTKKEEYYVLTCIQLKKKKKEIQKCDVKFSSDIKEHLCLASHKNLPTMKM